MATAIESAPRHPVGNDRDDIMGARTVPIINTSQTPIIKTSAPSDSGDPMDITTPTKDSSKSPDGEGGGSAERHTNGNSNDQLSASASMPAPAVAAAAVHQPKIVQTAFIHKLYKYVSRARHISLVAINLLTPALACWRTKIYST